MADSIQYIENKIYTTTAGVEPCSALLLRLGIDGTAVEDSADMLAILENKDRLDWDYVDPSLFRGDYASDLSVAEARAAAKNDGLRGDEAVVSFYTPDDPAGEKLLQVIRVELLKLKSDEQYGHYGAAADFGRLYMESQPLTDTWKEKWKEGFKAFRFTERFVVRPPWDEGGSVPLSSGPADLRYPLCGEFPATPAKVSDNGLDSSVIVIDPGMAFGTGSHETTSLCAAAIERFLQKGDNLLDIGTGSGILAIAAVLLGAGRVVAVEIDADAAASARHNFERNGVADKIELIVGDVRTLNEGEKTPCTPFSTDTGSDCAPVSTDGESEKPSPPSFSTDTGSDCVPASTGEGAKTHAQGFDVIVANLTSGLLKTILPQIKDLFAGNQKSGANQQDRSLTAQNTTETTGIQEAEGNQEAGAIYQAETNQQTATNQRRGKLILSGLLCTEEDEMKRVVRAAGFDHIEAEQKGEWLLICADC